MTSPLINHLSRKKIAKDCFRRKAEEKAKYLLSLQTDLRLEIHFKCDR